MTKEEWFDPINLYIFKLCQTLHLEYLRLQPRAMKMTEDLKQPKYEARLKELGIFNFRKIIFQLFEPFCLFLQGSNTGTSQPERLWPSRYSKFNVPCP